MRREVPSSVHEGTLVRHDSPAVRSAPARLQKAAAPAASKYLEMQDPLAATEKFNRCVQEFYV